MPSNESTAPRTLRSDAHRNREKLVAVAREAFTSTDDPVPLEGIARSAGVGIGTLYRHFPTREALIEAVYAVELDAVTASSPALLAQLTPDLALRAWMQRYADFVGRKRGMVDTLQAGRASGWLATRTTRDRITQAIDTILQAGIDAGLFRVDVDATDVTAMVLGVVLSTATNETTDQTRRLLDLIVDALEQPLPAGG